MEKLRNFWNRLTTFGKGVILGVLIMSAIVFGSWFVKQDPNNVFRLIYPFLLGNMIFLFNQHVYKPIKKKREKKSLTKRLLEAQTNRTNLTKLLSDLEDKTEREVSRPGVTEEWQMQYVDAYLKQKTTLESALRTMESVIQSCSMELQFFHEMIVPYGTRGVGVSRHTRNLLMENAHIHDVLEDSHPFNILEAHINNLRANRNNILESRMRLEAMMDNLNNQLDETGR
jgi:hypothetical protein